MQTIFNDGESHQPRYRSGAVARMLAMPVATLRIWERRYRVTAPRQTDTGHRLYSAADVERLLLIKQLVDLGHAIGSVAGMETPALVQLAEARAALAVSAGQRVPARPRAVLLGVGLAQRLGMRRLQRVGSWLDLAEAEAACRQSEPGAVDLLVAELATLQPAVAERLLALKTALGEPAVVVVYAFGTEAAAQALREGGCLLRRTPLADDELRAAVDEVLRLRRETSAALAGAAGTAGASGAAGPGGEVTSAAVAGIGTPADLTRSPSTTWPPVGMPDAERAPPPRRFDNAALLTLANQSGAVACECPRHLADLVRLLADFERYSAECAHRGPADAALHRHLQQVAGHARAMIEAALLQVAEAEGLLVPPA